MSGNACVIGAGPNGLAAAIVLAQAGLHVDVLEAETMPGGAARTLELTLPGFQHDFGSAVHPLAAGSPFFSSLPLSDHGLEWIQSPAPLAHPLDDGTAVVLERDLLDTKASLGADGEAWVKLMRPFVDRWSGIRSGDAATSSEVAETSVANGPLRYDRSLVGQNYCWTLSQPADARVICWLGSPFISQSQRIIERSHGHADGSPGARGGMANSTRRFAVAY